MLDLPHRSRTKLLEATLKVVRSKGYNAARIEDICAQAGVTKGSFFHHFKSKDEVGLAAVAYWREGTSAFFAQADYHQPADPAARLLAYVALRKTMLAGELSEFTCYPGTIVQEAYATHPELREACTGSLCGHAATLEADVAAAMEQSGIAGRFSPESLAQHIEFTIQGAFILAKATGGPDAAAHSLDHLRRYLELLFAPERDGTKVDPAAAGTTNDNRRKSR